MTKLNILKQEALDCLTHNILPFWLNNMRDHERGGWYGQMTGDYRLQKDAPRGAILNARLLWTFSAAYRVLKDDAFLSAATMTCRYILRHFVDAEYGGTFWSVTADGQPLDTKKQFYAIGFMVYAFSEYARATATHADAGVRAASAEALATALNLFDVIERHAWDAEFGGYIEATTRQWQPIADMRLSDKDDNAPKSQNTHLHIIEPYTNLLRAVRERQTSADADATLHAQETRIALAVRSLIDLFTSRILNPDTCHLDLFFAMDWTRLSRAESYGHDIECSWLLHEAALVLGDSDVLSMVEPIVKMVAQASEKGINPDGSMIHEADPSAGTVDGDLHWWVQAEAVVGFLNLYQHFRDEAALDKALRCWQYIKDNLIDREHGEWFWSRHADGTLNAADDKAGFWKCPYHNGRMCLEIIERSAS